MNSTYHHNESLYSAYTQQTEVMERIKRNRSELINHYYAMKNKEQDSDKSFFGTKNKQALNTTLGSKTSNHLSSINRSNIYLSNIDGDSKR